MEDTLVDILASYRLTFEMKANITGTSSDWKQVQCTITAENNSTKLTGYGFASGKPLDASIHHDALTRALSRLARQVEAMKGLE